MKMLTCAQCKDTKRVPDHYKDCCSRKCARAFLKQRDPAAYVAQRQVAGAAAGAASTERAAAHWAKKYPGVPFETVQKIRRDGYHTGFVSGQRAGFQQGWDAAEAQARLAGVRTIVVRDDQAVPA